MATIISPGLQSTSWGGGGGMLPWYYDPNAWQQSTDFNRTGKTPGGRRIPQPTLPSGGIGGGTNPLPSLPSGGGTGGGGGTPTVQTSITPTNIYTPQMTAQAVNQAVASNTPDMRFAMKQNTQPGVSRSAGTMAGAMPAFSKAALSQRQAAAEIPLLDEIANQKHMMAGQVARENEGLQLANLLSRLQSLRDRESLGNAGNLQNILLSMLG